MASSFLTASSAPAALALVRARIKSSMTEYNGCTLSGTLGAGDGLGAGAGGGEGAGVGEGVGIGTTNLSLFTYTNKSRKAKPRHARTTDIDHPISFGTRPVRTS